MTKRILMIAFHFPPSRGGSGVHRTTTFSRYLTEDHGWQVTVLSVHPRAYADPGADLDAGVPDGVRVVRAFGADAMRYLSFRGRYPARVAVPDRFWPWRFAAVRAGLRIAEGWQPDLLWSTFPVATAHRIGLELHNRTGLPWIADFRDSMTEDDYPAPRVRWRACRDIERQAVELSERAVFTTPGAVAMYRERYPELPEQRFTMIENGFDERLFAQVEASVEPSERSGRILLVHSGLLYRSERDPRAFFAALGELRRAGKISGDTLGIRLRASGDEDHHRAHIRAEGIEDIVELADPVPYAEALREMLRSDGLLLFQAANCNHQIPAKTYEYLRTRKPMFALTDSAGDTADLLRRAGTGTVVPLDSKERIVEALPGFLDLVRAGAATAAPAGVEQYSRRARARELAALLAEVHSGA